MELKEMIKVMQHYESGGVVQRCNFGSHNYSDITTEDYLFNFCDYKYRIKEQKQKVTIGKWLLKDIDSGEYFIMESSDVNLTLKDFPKWRKLKLIETYEVEL